ncbi:MAG: ribitol-5-phosphate 2-dehydrogenase / D-ribitol-5-phosphate cytidylyltransferase [Streptosporangiaceae bacterium]|jgi:2-C-methyl-D-erythritol 4-phosphate cytidylyltransferase|nr:ribitol-5-phosphate 2-dehydrogenase / D-ribitol-5-phosphate cytidylyltransferase [Streptosporangiaceae bacterium]
MRTVAVVLAGGSGQRFGSGLPKQLLPLTGRTLIEHSVAAFEEAPDVAAVLVVMAAGHSTHVAELLKAGGYQKVMGVIEGGASRPDSTWRAIAELCRTDLGPTNLGRTDLGRTDLGQEECDVLFHDAARPLVDQRIIADCVRALRTHEAVGVVVPASDTIVIVDNDVMTSMPRRDRMRHCQTPQGFRLQVIRRAYELALADPAFTDLASTDDCGVVLRYLPEVTIAVVPGSERNMKITYPDDLRVAESLLKH